jgi:hypothetical protein
MSDDDAYVGVSAEYRNYANDTEKPYLSPDAAERKAEVQVSRAAERNQVELNEFALPIGQPVTFASGSADPDEDLDEAEENDTSVEAPTAEKPDTKKTEPELF